MKSSFLRRIAASQLSACCCTGVNRPALGNLTLGHRLAVNNVLFSWQQLWTHRFSTTSPYSSKQTVNAERVVTRDAEAVACSIDVNPRISSGCYQCCRRRLGSFSGKRHVVNNVLFPWQQLWTRSFSVTSPHSTEQTVTAERVVTREDVEAFARLSGDTNPVHFSGQAIVHGALLNSYLSGVIGTKLPGPGTILVSQAFKFPHPCHIGDTIVIQVSLTDVRKISVCHYRITRKSDDRTLMEGEARVIVRTFIDNKS